MHTGKRIPAAAEAAAADLPDPDAVPALEAGAAITVTEADLFTVTAVSDPPVSTAYTEGAGSAEETEGFDGAFTDILKRKSSLINRKRVVAKFHL